MNHGLQYRVRNFIRIRLHSGGFAHYAARVLFLFTFLFTLSSFSQAQTKIVGYYPDWMKYTLPANEISFENLTHIIHAFAWPNSDGTINMYSGMLNQQLNNAVHNAGKKILLAFGGWGQSDGFAEMAADSAKRENFVNNAANLLTTYQYDGIDLDWEYPSNSTEGKNLTLLVKDLREKFDQIDSSLLITMAVTPGNYQGKNLEYEKLVPYIDWFAMMGYDFHGSWTSHTGHNAPLFPPSSSVNCFEGAESDGFHYLTVTRNIPEEKVLFGVPFYGRQFNSSGLYQSWSGTVSDLLYSAISPMLNDPMWEYHWDNVSQVPYLQDTAHTKFITFEDTASIRKKCEYVLQKQLGGIMIWALGQDYVGNSQPLLEQIGSILGPLTAVEEETKTVYEFQLFENYPNPFNPSTNIRYSLPHAGNVSLKIYNVTGEMVKTIFDDEFKAQGSHEIRINMNNFSSGVYFYTIWFENNFITKKMILLR